MKFFKNKSLHVISGFVISCLISSNFTASAEVGTVAPFSVIKKENYSNSDLSYEDYLTSMKGSLKVEISEEILQDYDGVALFVSLGQDNKVSAAEYPILYKKIDKNYIYFDLDSENNIKEIKNILDLAPITSTHLFIIKKEDILNPVYLEKINKADLISFYETAQEQGNPEEACREQDDIFDSFLSMYPQYADLDQNFIERVINEEKANGERSEWQIFRAIQERLDSKIVEELNGSRRVRALIFNPRTGEARLVTID